MKIFNIIFEIVFSPFTAILKVSSSKKNLSNAAKTGIIFAVAIALVCVFILFCYKSYIFK